MIKPPARISNPLTTKVIEIRRKIHQYPELSNQEHATQKLVEQELRRAGLENIQHVVGTGLVVDIEGASAEKRLVLRADMDALSIQEERPDLTFASANDGVMHACGHDAHTAMLLGAAMMLHDTRDQLRGSVRCVFQPAEEAEPLGGRAIVADGVLNDADAALALHIDPDIEAGYIGVCDGAMLAGGMEFTLTVKGRSAHAARPHRGVDSIYIAAGIVQGLQSIASRQVDPMEPFVLTLGKISGGTAKNIIAEQTVIEGTARVLSERLRESVPKLILNTAKSIAATHGASVELDISSGEPVLENDPSVNELTRRAATRVIGADKVIELPVGSMGSEDFAFYTQTLPGAMFRLGVRAKNDTEPYPLHHPKLNVDESALPVGIDILVEASRDFLS